MKIRTLFLLLVIPVFFGCNREKESLWQSPSLHRLPADTIAVVRYRARKDSAEIQDATLFASTSGAIGGILSASSEKALSAFLEAYGESIPQQAGNYSLKIPEILKASLPIPSETLIMAKNQQRLLIANSTSELQRLIDNQPVSSSVLEKIAEQRRTLLLEAPHFADQGVLAEGIFLKSSYTADGILQIKTDETATQGQLFVPNEKFSTGGVSIPSTKETLLLTHLASSDLSSNAHGASIRVERNQAGGMFPSFLIAFPSANASELLTSFKKAAENALKQFGFSEIPFPSAPSSPGAIEEFNPGVGVSLFFTASTDGVFISTEREALEKKGILTTTDHPFVLEMNPKALVEELALISDTATLLSGGKVPSIRSTAGVWGRISSLTAQANNLSSGKLFTFKALIPEK